MHSLAGKPPTHLPQYREADYNCLNVKLKTYYARKRKLYQDTYPDFYDADLRQLFGAPAGIRAGVYLRRRKRRLLNSVCQWTNEKKYRVNKLLTRLADRADQLGLHVLNDDPQQDFRVTAFITTLVMNYLFYRQSLNARTKVSGVKKKLKVLVLFDGAGPTTLDQDFSSEMKTPDWQTEANVMAALVALGHTAEHLAIYDDVDLVRQKLETFAPDVLFNLVEQFRNKSGFDQNVASFLELQGLPFTGCGSTGLTLCKDKGISKKILHYHGIHVPNFVRDSARPARHTPETSEVSAPGKTGEGRSLVWNFSGFIRRERRSISRSRGVCSREIHQRRDRGGIHRRP